MYNEEEIEDSLAFCKEIRIYREADYARMERIAAENGERVDTYEMVMRGEVCKEYSKEKKRQSLEVSAMLPEAEVTFSERKIIKSPFLQFLSMLCAFAICIAAAYCIASFVTRYVAHQTTVEGQSMEPTLADGDSVIIQKLSYYWSEPKRYDVVVFPVKAEEISKTKDFYVKRIIGLPNETIQVINGTIYVDGEKLWDDEHGLSKILDSGNAEDPIHLGKDEYFVLGDNRNMSTDSRSSYVGLVKREEIVGQVLCCVWPFSHIGIISY